MHKEVRYRFISDEECHWFLIPVELEERFYDLLENGEEDYYAEFSHVFGKYRCDSINDYTFTNPKGLT